MSFELRRRNEGRRFADRCYRLSLAVVAILLLVVMPVESDGAVLMRGPYLLNQHATGVTLRWRTDASVRHTAVVRFGRELHDLGQVVAATEVPVHFSGVQEWEAMVSGLESGVKYFYAIEVDEAVIVGADEDHYFRTAQLSNSVHRFWLLGDSGSNRPRAGSWESVLGRRTVNDAVKVRNGFRSFNQGQELDGLIMLGDNAYPMGTDEQYQAAFSISIAMSFDRFRCGLVWGTMTWMRLTVTYSSLGIRLPMMV
jgi:hypothetical protein